MQNYIQVLSHFSKKPDAIRKYFKWFESLVKEYPWDVSVAYVFSKLELAQRSTLYGGLRKLHKTDSALTWKLVSENHMTRPQFQSLFKSIFGKEIDKALLDKLGDAEAIRDKVMHGQPWKDAEARKALADIFDFSEGFNSLVAELAGFTPFGSMQGFVGSQKPLSPKTTYWVLRGILASTSKKAD